MSHRAWADRRRVLLLLLMVPALTAAQGSPLSSQSAQIAMRLSELATEQRPTVRAQTIAALGVIDTFYARRGFAPAWNEPAKAQALLAAVGESGEDGLIPRDYHVTALEQLAADIGKSDATDHQRADFDILMTDAAIRLGYHLWFGKVDPVRFDAGWNLARRVPGLDPAEEIEKALATPDLAATIQKQRPDLPLYAGLKRELARYKAVAMRGGWKAIPSGPTLRPGQTDTRVPALRARLGMTGELPADAEPTSASSAEIYDQALVQAVREFQTRTGSSADGVVGPATLAALNVSVDQRILQLRVNLDRGRVLLHDLPPEFVVVNIAAQEVYFARDRKVIWSSRAQVGKEYRQTPEYRSDINYLVFNPTWTVPPGIIRNDILPAARRDPSSITRKGLKVLDSSGREVAPSSVDWQRFTSGNIPYTLRQDPGPTNALGRVKFMFPNPYAVYLHDTPSRSLFANDTRTTSSGCVRVEKPMELAELLLDDPRQWSRAQIDQVVASERLRNVTLAKRVPVLLVYWTAWVDRNDVLNFRSDVYGRDAKWAKALDEPFRFRSQPVN